MNKPIIGILLDHETKTVKDGGYSNFPWYALRHHYSKAITAHGGIPVLIPYEESMIPEYLKLCSGLLTPGGDYDIPPKYYEEELKVKKINIAKDYARAKFELDLIKAAIKTKIPILGICAGQQMLNVALGGNLYQDLEEQFKTNIIHHRHSPNDHENVHDINVATGSLLHKITGKTRYIVNSFHHQAIKLPGQDLIVSATAPDGVIECIEHTELPFCIGVEWHPEFEQTEEDKKLFEAFVDAARKHKR